MPLVDHCEPFFQQICRLNRSARASLRVDAAVARQELIATLGEARSKAASTGLGADFDRVELPLMCFADSMIRAMPGPLAESWSGLAEEKGEAVGDEKFFDLLEETLRDSSEQANERLAVFYVCLGLGFTGWYKGQPEVLRKKMVEISARIRHLINADETARICPDAYEHVDRSNLVEPPSRSIAAIGVALVGVVVVLLLMNGYLYYESSSGLIDSLTRFVERADSVAARTDGE